MFEYLRNDSLEVNIINDNVYITNYLEVLSFSREEIKLKHKDGIIKVIGEDLVIKKLLKDEILIHGKIKSIEYGWNMKNSIIDSFKSKIVIKISGRNIDNFINRLIKNHINIISMDYINYKEITIAKNNDHNKKYEILLIKLFEDENVDKVVNSINNNSKYNKNEYEVITRDNYILLVIDPHHEITSDLKKYFKKY